MRGLAILLLAMAAIAAAFIAGPWDESSEAHRDPPGPPPILVAATLDTLSSNHGGELFDEEILVEIVASQLPGHPNSPTYSNALLEDVSFETGDAPLTLNKPIYIHRECDPMHTLSLSFRVTEIDTDVKVTIAAGLLAAAAFPAAYAIPAVGLALAGASAIVFLISLNGDDDLGTITAGAPPLGTFAVTTIGGGAGEGSANVVYTVAKGAESNLECGTLTPTSTSPSTPTPTATSTATPTPAATSTATPTATATSTATPT